MCLTVYHKMRPKLYMTEICPAARAILLTAKVLEVTLEEKIVKLKNKDPLCRDYHKINNQHLLPALEDNGYVIWDSHAIIAYLVGKYGKDDTLYPRDPIKRSMIDQRLDFDSGVVAFFTQIILNPMLYQKENYINEEQVDCLYETYEVIEKFFDNNQWIAGDQLTIADLSLIPSITSLNVLVPINEKEFPKVVKWIRKAESMPFYEPNKIGLERLRINLKV